MGGGGTIISRREIRENVAGLRSSSSSSSSRSCLRAGAARKRERRRVERRVERTARKMDKMVKTKEEKCHEKHILYRYIGNPMPY